MTNKKFIETLSAVPTFIGDKERQVEQAYNAMLIDAFPGIQISNPYKCDGYFETEIGGKKTGVIMEYKYNLDFSSKTVRSGVLAQVMFYLKRFEKDGKPFPAVVLIGDVNECFVIHSNHLLKFLDIEGVDWSVAPSSASSQTELVLALASDENRNAFVYDIVDGFDFSNVVKQIEDCAANVVRLIHITEHNVDSVFKLFCDKVVKSSMSPNDLVGLFLGCIVDSANNYLHPKKKGVLVTPNGEVKVNHGNFLALISHFDTENVSPVEKKRLSEICDRLIEDTTRRKQGAFFTPTEFVDYAYHRIELTLGENWRDEYVVIDPCCGTGNLTRDYVFKELYRSSLEKSEVDLANKYNRNSEPAFVFDFLNDEIKRKSEGGKIPDEMMDALKGGKKILFLMNPPYGKAGGKLSGGKFLEGITNTLVKQMMHDEKIEGSELLKQFLWRVAYIKRKFNIKDCAVACFTNPSWMIKPQSKKFRDLFFNLFAFKDGILFCASAFSDVSSDWGISFSIWNSETWDNKNCLTHTLIGKDENNSIVELGEKTLYNFDGLDTISPAEYISVGLGKKHKENVIWCKDIKKMTFKQSEINVYDGFLCAMASNSSDIQKNRMTYISNSYPKCGGGILQLTKSNMLECCVVQAIRSLIVVNWINAKDMYNMNVDIPMSFKLDAFIYSLFSNYCCSVKLENGELRNSLFWMSVSEIMELVWVRNRLPMSSSNPI